MLSQIGLNRMEFKQVIKVCLEFSQANGGSIQSFGYCDPDKLEVHSRTTRTEILIDQSEHGVWQAEQTQNAAGEKNSLDPSKELVLTEVQLLEYLSRLWNK